MQALPLWFVRVVNPLVAGYAEFDRMIRRHVGELLRQYKTNTLVSTKRTDEGYSSIFHEILRSSLPKSEKTVVRMTHEAGTIIGAATETTSNVSSNIVYFMAANLEYADRLNNELKTLMPHPTSTVMWKDLERLPFLTTVIKESLRLTAQVYGRLPLVAPEQALKYKEWIIPPGTYVGMSPVDFLHHPEIFPSPTTFNPDRWLTASPEHLKRMETAFMPFGRGPRMCLGINLAYASLYHFIAALCRRFQFEPVDTIQERDINVTRDHFVVKPTKGSKGIKVRILKERL